MSQVCEIVQVFLLHINYVLAAELRPDRLVRHFYSAGVDQEKPIEHFLELFVGYRSVVHLLAVDHPLLLSLVHNSVLVFHLWALFSNLDQRIQILYFHWELGPALLFRISPCFSSFHGFSLLGVLLRQIRP